MRLALFSERADVTPRVGVLTDDGVVAVDDLVDAVDSPQARMQRLIDAADELRLVLERRMREGRPVPHDAVRLLAPLPEPGKLVCALEDDGAPEGHTPRMYLKNPDAVHGDGDVLELPERAAGLRHDVKLAAVVKGPAKALAREAWQTAVFGYLCLIDLTRPPQDEWGISWQTSFDTPCAIGPCIVTADEIPDPGALRARIGPGRAGAEVGSAGERLPELIELATSVMTLYTGDLVVCGPSARVPSADDARELEAEIERLGAVRVGVEPALGAA